MLGADSRRGKGRSWDSSWDVVSVTQVTDHGGLDKGHGTEGGSEGRCFVNVEPTRF